MTQHIINGALLKDMILAGAALLEQNKKHIDSLNVFPVPDGDTGTNMSMTITAAVRELKTADTATVASVATAVSRGALRGARGNSGVILSQIFRGFAKALEDLTEMGPSEFSAALQSGVEAAYKAVMKPKEGTILTVAAHIAKGAQQDAESGANVYKILDNMLANGKDILAKTPDMLPVLKEAGVVDAGGKGLLIIYHGFKMALDGEEISELPQPVEEESPSLFEDSVDFESLEDIEFAYCTEFFIERPDESFSESDVQNLTDHLQRIGDSVVCVGDKNLIKIHVHTNAPGKALQLALRLGEINGVKIDNMVAQNRKLIEERKANEKEYGMVAVSAGDGFSNILKDLTVDEIVQGGQSMNPSAESISKAIKRVPARNVFVFPNNKNIILAAQQAQDLIEKSNGHNVIIIPSTSMPQGIAGILEFNPECSLEENTTLIKDAISRVYSGAVTKAVRSTTVNGYKIKEGEYIGLLDDDIVAHGKKLQPVAEELLQKMVESGRDYVTIFYGEDVKEADAQAFRVKIEKQYSDADVILQNGGQPLYSYLFSVE